MVDEKNNKTAECVASFIIGAEVAILMEMLMGKSIKPKKVLPAGLVGGGLGLLGYGMYDALKNDDDTEELDNQEPIYIAYNGKEHFMKFSQEKIRKGREKVALEEFNFYFPEALYVYLSKPLLNGLAAEFVTYKMQDEIVGFGNFLLEDNKNMMLDAGFAIFVILCSTGGFFDKKTSDSLTKVYLKHEKEIKQTLNIKKLKEFFNVLFKENLKNALDKLKVAFKKGIVNDGLILDMSECLKTYAKKLFPKVGRLYEEQKNEIFNEQDLQSSKEAVLESAKKTVAILLWEFATGSGKTERIFTQGNFFTAFLNVGRKYGKVDKVEIIKDKIRAMRCSLEQFKNNGITIKKIEFSPDDKDISFEDSYNNHFRSNIAQLFIGGVGAISVTYEGRSNGKIKMHVQFSNDTGMKSLFLHLADDVLRSEANWRYDGTFPPLSNIKQVFDFYIYADESEGLFL